MNSPVSHDTIQTHKYGYQEKDAATLNQLIAAYPLKHQLLSDVLLFFEKNPDPPVALIQEYFNYFIAHPEAIEKHQITSDNIIKLIQKNISLSDALRLKFCYLNKIISHEAIKPLLEYQDKQIVFTEPKDTGFEEYINALKQMPSSLKDLECEWLLKKKVSAVKLYIYEYSANLNISKYDWIKVTDGGVAPYGDGNIFSLVLFPFNHEICEIVRRKGSQRMVPLTIKRAYTIFKELDDTLCANIKKSISVLEGSTLCNLLFAEFQKENRIFSPSNINMLYKCSTIQQWAEKAYKKPYSIDWNKLGFSGGYLVKTCKKYVKNADRYFDFCNEYWPLMENIMDTYFDEMNSMQEALFYSIYVVAKQCKTDKFCDSILNEVRTDMSNASIIM